MDVEGLLNLENYVPPQAEKQIAKIPSDPPPLYEETDPLAIAGPSDDLEAEDEFVDATTTTTTTTTTILYLTTLHLGAKSAR